MITCHYRMNYLKINHHQLEFLDRNYAVILTFLQPDFAYFLTFSNQGNERLQRSEKRRQKDKRVHNEIQLSMHTCRSCVSGDPQCAFGNYKKIKTVRFRSAEGARAYRFNGAPRERYILPDRAYAMLGEYTGWTAG